MKKHEAMRIAAAVALVLVAGGAQAAERVGNTNEFTFGGGKYSFSLSLTQSSGVVGVRDLPKLTPRVNSGGTPASSSYAIAGGGYLWDYLDGQDATHYAGVYSGSTGSVQAPMAAPGVAFANPYMAAANMGASSTQEATNIWFTPTSAPGSWNTSPQAVKSMEILWGSVEAGNQLFLGTTGAITSGAFTLSGSEVLAAATTLGLGAGIGGSGSYYVTLNGTGTNGFSSAWGFSGSNVTMEWAALNVSTSGANYASRDAFARGGATALGMPAPSVGQGAAPAPLPALAGTVPGLLAAAGMMLSRRRKAVEAV